MILAAGLGTRMRPITDTLPKPLVKVNGKTMLDYGLDAFVDGGVKKAVVNVHYFADQIEAHLANRKVPQVAISDERSQLLNSGGGVKKGLSQMSDEPFVLLNADSFWIDYGGSSLSMLKSRWDCQKMDMLMLLAPLDKAVGFDGKGDFFRAKDGTLTRRNEAKAAPFAYAGALIAKPELYLSITEDAFNMNILFDQLLANGKLFGEVLDGLWLHVGTPGAIDDAEAAIKKEFG